MMDPWVLLTHFSNVVGHSARRVHPPLMMAEFMDSMASWPVPAATKHPKLSPPCFFSLLVFKYIYLSLSIPTSKNTPQPPSISLGMVTSRSCRDSSKHDVCRPKSPMFYQPRKSVSEGLQHFNKCILRMTLLQLQLQVCLSWKTKDTSNTPKPPNGCVNSPSARNQQSALSSETDCESAREAGRMQEREQ